MILCPKCNSKNVEYVQYMGAKCIVCKDCGFDERTWMDQVPEERTSQKAKGEFNPYKQGGKNRSK